MHMSLKSKFFDTGYLKDIKILGSQEALKIVTEYESFINEKNLSNVEAVEHKSKTHLYFEWANQIIKNDKIISNVKEILGENLYCWNSLIFYKSARSKKFVSMHQDQNYWGIKHDKALTVSLALTESNVDNGCLKILPYSHKENFSHENFESRDNMLARGQSISLDIKKKNNLENIELKPAHCCIFHGNIVHGSGQNNSLKPRFLYSMRFLTTDNVVNKKFYYNDATLVSGKDNFNYFKPEPHLTETNSIKDLRKLHKKILISQFSKYLLIKLKSKFFLNILMFFFKFDILRGFGYFLVGKTKN